MDLKADKQGQTVAQEGRDNDRIEGYRRKESAKEDERGAQQMQPVAAQRDRANGSGDKGDVSKGRDC